MKNNILALGIILFFTNSLFAQQKGNLNNEKTIFEKPLTGEEITLNVNLYNYDMNTIGQLKDDLFQFQYVGKISLISLDEFKKILTIIYNEKMLESDFIRVFNDNKVNFLLKNKPNTDITE